MEWVTKAVTGGEYSVFVDERGEIRCKLFREANSFIWKNMVNYMEFIDVNKAQIQYEEEYYRDNPQMAGNNPNVAVLDGNIPGRHPQGIDALFQPQVGRLHRAVAPRIQPNAQVNWPAFAQPAPAPEGF